MEEDRRQYLQMIQDIITRMNSNSFTIKSLMIGVVSACLALYVDNKEWYLIQVPILPAFLFWGLDAYYLQQERKYRGLFNDVASRISSAQDNQNVEPPLYSMNTASFVGGKYSYWRVVFSKTLLPLYGLTILALAALVVVFAI